jgi:hypothetical protein
MESNLDVISLVKMEFATDDSVELLLTSAVADII